MCKPFSCLDFSNPAANKPCELNEMALHDLFSWISNADEFEDRISNTLIKPSL